MRCIESFFGRVLVVLAAAAFSCPAFAAYDFVSIPDYPGAGQTDAFGINNAGTVVGNAYDPAGQPLAAYSYDSKKGRFTTLTPIPPAALRISASGINELGEIVGSAIFADITQGFVLSNKGAYTLFSHPGSSNTNARANNNNGLIGGYFVDDNTTNAVGFIYDTASQTFIDILPGGVTIAQGINNKGQIVGSTVLDAGVACTGCPAGTYGWLRAPNGVISFFQVNGESTSARGITDSGLITGFISTGEGFVTKLTGAASYQSITIPAAQLLVYPGAITTNPEAINDAGAIVGFWTDADGNRHAFIATPH